MAVTRAKLARRITRASRQEEQHEVTCKISKREIIDLTNDYRRINARLDLTIQILRDFIEAIERGRKTGVA